MVQHEQYLGNPNLKKADKLVDLQKKMKEIDEVNTKQNTTNVTNNSLFVGSTSELQKMLKKTMKENNK